MCLTRKRARSDAGFSTVLIHAHELRVVRKGTVTAKRVDAAGRTLCYRSVDGFS